MATRLEISENKLKRLEVELLTAQQNAYDHMKQTNWQPMNDKRNCFAFFKKRDLLANIIFAKMHEIEEQKNRIESLKYKEFRRKNHLTPNYGLQTSVHNIEELKKRKQTKATRQKIAALELMVNKSNKDNTQMTEHVRFLIENGKVTKWEKQPIFYFVKGLRKVALTINDNGEFIISKKYPPKTEDDQKIVDELLTYF